MKGDIKEITTISISRKHKIWLKNRFISLSKFIASKIEEEMHNE